MRFAGFSLVGVLVVVGILMLIQNFYTAPMLKTASNAIPQAQQLSGRGTGTGLKPGMAFSDSFTYTDANNGSRFKGIQITTVDPAGPLATYYSAIPGDVITGIVGRGDWATLSATDGDTAVAHLQQFGYQASMAIAVERPGVGKIELPRDAALLPPTGQGSQATVTPQPQQPATPAPQLTTPTPPTGASAPPRRPTVWDRLDSTGKQEEPQ